MIVELRNYDEVMVGAMKHLMEYVQGKWWL